MFHSITGMSPYMINENAQIIRFSSTAVFIKPVRLRSGYEQIRLYTREGVRLEYVHKIMRRVFYPLHWGEDVDHLNKIRHDNRLENLQIVTHRENIQRARRTPQGEAPDIQLEMPLIK